jgi:nucleoid DNA-binding protein
VVDFSRYIEELLDEHEYVIVPGLGAFVTVNRPAEFGKGHAFILPPSRVISFKPELKINDGLLAGYIARQQKVNLRQAQKLLDGFAGDILYMLDQGKEVTIGKAGSLVVRKGEIIFRPETLSSENAGSFGLSPVTIPAIPEQPGPPAEKFPKEENGKMKFPWFWTGMIVLIAVISVAGYFLVSRKSASPVIPASGTFKDTVRPEQGISREQAGSLNTGTTGISPAIQDSGTFRSRKGYYFTIGGSFRSQENANEYSDKMVRKGYHPVQLGLIGKFYLVALDSFYTANEAFESADRYMKLNRDSSGVWVYHFR